LEAVADYFVICTGDVDQQVRAIVDHIERQVRAKTGERVLHREGTDTMNWVLLDYIDVVVHVFKPSFREFYRLEDLWGDAEVTSVTDELTMVTKPKPMRRRVAVASTKPETARTKAARAKKAAAKKPATKTKRSPAAAPAKPVRKPAAKKAVKKPAAKSSTAKSPATKRLRKSGS
jgi:ribosome silencing factor RsfS/YbeB/iojap